MVCCIVAPSVSHQAPRINLFQKGQLHVNAHNRLLSQRLGWAARTADLGRRPLSKLQVANLCKTAANSVDAPSSMTADKLDCIIVGGGPGGLAAAVALRKAFGEQISVTVLESADAYVAHGTQVLLHLNGQAALEALDPQLLQVMQDLGNKWQTGSQMYDQQGNNFGTTGQSVTLPLLAKCDRQPLTVLWRDLRDTLYKSLPKGAVQFGSKVLSVSQAADGVRVNVQRRMADGNTKEEVLGPAALLIGADGPFSQVRKSVLNDGPPAFKDEVWWRGIAKTTAQVASLDEPELYGNMDNGMMGLKKDMWLRLSPCDGGVYWVGGGPVEVVRAKGVPFTPHSTGMGFTGNEIKQRALMVFSAFPSKVLQYVKVTAEDQILEHGFYIRESEQLLEQWGHGLVTLLGDSAHERPPDGQGCNLAIEDAVELAHSLQKYGITDQALRIYEAARTERIKELDAMLARRQETEDTVRLLYRVKYEPVQYQPEKFSTPVASNQQGFDQVG